MSAKPSDGGSSLSIDRNALRADAPASEGFGAQRPQDWGAGVATTAAALAASLLYTKKKESTLI